MFVYLNADSVVGCSIVGIAQQNYGGNLPQILISRVNSKVLGSWLSNYKRVLLDTLVDGPGRLNKHAVSGTDDSDED